MTPDQDTEHSERVEGELDVEDVTPEELDAGQSVIDGDFIIDRNGVRRDRNGRLLPGSSIGRGRPKGVRYREFRTAMVKAFHDNGGTEWLASWGRDHPSQFFRLMARMIPLELQGELKSSGNIRITLAPSPLDEVPPGMQPREDAPLVIDGRTGEVIGGQARSMTVGPEFQPDSPAELPVFHPPRRGA